LGSIVFLLLDGVPEIVAQSPLNPAATAQASVLGASGYVRWLVIYVTQPQGGFIRFNIDVNMTDRERLFAGASSYS
jgi:hypothetical protein